MINYPSLNFQKWPLTLKIAGFVLLNGIIVIGFWFFVFRNEVAQLRKLQEFEIFQKENYALNMSHVQNNEQLNRQLDALSNLYKHQVKRYCFMTDQALNKYFIQLAKSANVKIHDMNIQLMREHHDMFVQPINVRIAGEVKQVDLFFQQISQLKKIADIDSLSIIKQNNQLLVRCHFVSIINDNI